MKLVRHSSANAFGAIFLLSLSLSAASVSAADAVRLSLNTPSGVYEAGEPITVTAAPAEPSEDADAAPGRMLMVKVLKNNNTLLSEASVPWASDESTVLFDGSFDEPVSLIVEATYGGETDAVGAVVAPHRLEPGLPRPDDFNAYWEEQKRLLASMPLEATMSPIALGEERSGFEAYDVEINAPGPRPARAILAKPAKAKPKSLPIVVKFHAAGVKGNWCRAHTSEALDLAARGEGALSLDLNAHGMLNHEPESYYEALEDGPLHQYWEIGIESRDDYYFRFMYLRFLRAIEFLTRQPEWDGERILVLGESQGGGQALAAAGLDPRVTAVVATVPAMCDFGGPLVQRKGGWPQPVDGRPNDPQVAQTVAYFDAAHLVAGSKAELLVEVGLVDKTCPATSIYAALNGAAGEKRVLPVPYRGHPWPEGEDLEVWKITIQAAKDAFIDEFLQ